MNTQLFTEIFQGRDDAYGAGECVKQPVTTEVIKRHLDGFKRIGRYPLSPDILNGAGTWWVVGDIDIEELGYAAIMYEAFEHIEIPCYIERSKSKGYHCWIFFSKPIEAKWARALMEYGIDILAKETKYQVYEIFPKQNALTQDDQGEWNYGNYINLPLFGTDLLKGKTTFLNPLKHYQPYPDQFEFLKTIKKVTPDQITKLIEMGELTEISDIHERIQRTHPIQPYELGMSGMLAEMMEKCAFCREFLPDTGTMHEELWYRFLTQVVCFEGGAELGYQLSSGSSKFDDETTRKKIAHAIEAKMKGLAPYTCAQIIDCQGWNSPDCDKCYASPAKRNASPAGLPYILKALENKKQEVIAQTTIVKPETDATVDILNFRCTDAGNAELFAEIHGQNLRYDHKREKWFRWNGEYWKIDDLKSVVLLAKETARTRLKSAISISDDEARAKQAKWAVSSESFSKINACLSLAEKEPEIAVDNSIWDNDAMLLQIANGVIDLRTGELRQSKREDYISLCANVEYDEKAKCPRELQFLNEVFDDNQNLVEYIQRAIGYSLTGNISEHCFFLCYGTGRNGKGTLLNSIGGMLKDYAAVTPFSTFEWSKYQQQSNDLAALRGVRFVSAQETQEARHLNEGRVKAVTGGDSITCRFLNKEFFTYFPTFKIWFSVNHLPVIRDSTLGMWSRVRRIPFNVSFVGREDKQLPEKLEAEKAGFLNWAIEGCLKWQKTGLAEPQEVLVETQKYQNESDLIALFLEEKVIIDRAMQTKASDLFSAYEEWAEANGEWQMSNQLFGRRMTEKGFRKEKRGSYVFYSGIGLGV